MRLLPGTLLLILIWSPVTVSLMRKFPVLPLCILVLFTLILSILILLAMRRHARKP